MSYLGANTFCKFVNQFSFTEETVTPWAAMPRIECEKSACHSMR